MTSEIEIDGFTVTSLLITATVCLVAIFGGWYTVRKRIKLSQVILGIFAYVLVMLLENIFDLLGLNLGLASTGIAYGLYMTLSVVFAREIIRIGAMRFGLQPSFDDADSSLGFALGFAGVYLFVCALYYFNCYTTATTYVSSGVEEFIASSGSDADEAMELVEMIAGQTGWQFIFLSVNRVFFMVREMSLCLLMWYAMEDRRIYYALVPLMHFIAMIPDGLYQAELLESTYVRDIATCVLSAGIAYLASREYNKREDQVAHYQAERLRVRKRH